ncbi:MAG: RNA polymerase sigma-70 factor [Bacteroidales bacterium]|nr:RNA polymerase sigma-70 factor [Bacteroidales bacterium]
MAKTNLNIKGRLTEEKFGLLFKRSRPVFIRIANSYVHDMHVAEDIVDESFVRLWEKRDEIMTENYEAYTFRIIINKCLDYLKLQQIQSAAKQNIGDAVSRMQMYDIISLQSCNPDSLFASEVEELIHKCIDSMPSVTREIFIANRFNGMTYNEISDKMGIPVRQVTSHIQYALRMLRHELQDYLVMLVFFMMSGI